MKKLTKLGKVIVTIIEIILVVISYLAIRNNGSNLSELSIITFGLVMFTSPFILDLIWEDEKMRKGEKSALIILGCFAIGSLLIILGIIFQLIQIS